MCIPGGEREMEITEERGKLADYKQQKKKDKERDLKKRVYKRQEDFRMKRG